MKLARNSIDGLLGAALPIFVALACIPMLVREIGPERYGILTIVWLLLGYFGAADFGIGRAITQRISTMKGDSPAKKANAVWSALISMTGFSLINALILYVFASWYFAGPFQIEEGLRAEAVRGVWILAVSNPIIAISGVLSGALIGLERFRLVSVCGIVSRSGLMLFPLLVALFYKHDLPMLILSAVAARLIGVLMLVGAVWKTFLQGHTLRFSRDEFGRLANFGAWIMLSALVGPMMVYADRFLVGAVMDATAVAAYAIPFDIAMRTLMLPAAVAQALFPRFAAESESASNERCRQSLIFVGQVFAPVIIALICVSDPLMKLWLGSSLDPRSVLIAQIILMGCWLNGLSNVPFALIQARGNPRYTAILHVIELPIFIALLAVLGSIFGLAGFAMAFSLRCLLDFILLMRQAKSADLKTFSHLGIPLGLIAMAMLAGFYVSSPWLLVFIAVLLGAFSAVNIVLRMPPQIRYGLAGLPWVGPVLQRFA